MKTFKPKFNMLAAAMLVMSLAAPVNAADFTFRYGNSQPEQAPRSQSMIYFKNLVEDASGGRITVDNYFGGVLGTEREMMDQVATGALDGTRGGKFTDANPAYNIFLMPFLVGGWDEMLRLINSEFANRINRGARKNGYHIPALGISQGFRVHTNTKRPLATIADFNGLKMRVPGQDVYLETAKSLGENPQTLDYSEVYQAMKTGVIDGQDNAYSNVWDYKIYEVSKYMSITNYSTGPDPFIVRLDWYEQLPNDLKAIFDDAARRAMAYSDGLNRASEQNYVEQLCTVLECNTVAAAELGKMATATKPVYDIFIGKGHFTQADVDEAKRIAQGE